MPVSDSYITADEINAAEAGIRPALGHKLTDRELGERLAKHRRGRYASQAFTRQAISMYRREPEQQGDDFVEAFRSWFAAETLRQDELHVRLNRTTIDELLSESGRVIQLGDGDATVVIALGKLPDNAVMVMGEAGIPRVVESQVKTIQCVCGVWFQQRSWNHRRCQACKEKKR